jgi:transposase
LIWLLAGGASLAEASEWVGLHYTNAHIWMKRFREGGVAGLLDQAKSGRPRRYGDDATTEAIKAAAARPKNLGLKFTTWSLPKLREYLRRHPGLESITRSTIRRRLRQEGFGFRDGQPCCGSQDPDCEVKKQNRKALSPSAARRNRVMRRRTGAAGNDTSRRAPRTSHLYSLQRLGAREK